jgi:hypothetical protein
MAVDKDHLEGHLGDTSLSHSKTSYLIQLPANTTSKKLTVGQLYYRLSGFFALQSFCSALLKEIRDLRTQRMMPSSELKETKTVTDPDGTPTSSADRLHSRGDGDHLFLFPSLYRNMQVKLMRLEQSLASVEGMDAIGLVQV